MNDEFWEEENAEKALNGSSRMELEKIISSSSETNIITVETLPLDLGIQAHAAPILVKEVDAAKSIAVSTSIDGASVTPDIHEGEILVLYAPFIWRFEWRLLWLLEINVVWKYYDINNCYNSTCSRVSCR